MYAVVVFTSSMKISCPLITSCVEEANHKVDTMVKEFIESCKKNGRDYKQVDNEFKHLDNDSNSIREVHLYLNGLFYMNIQIFEE